MRERKRWKECNTLNKFEGGYVGKESALRERRKATERRTQGQHHGDIPLLSCHARISGDVRPQYHGAGDP